MQTLWEANSRKYVTNICPKFGELRENTCRELDKLINTSIKIRDKFKRDLERALLDVYFKPGSKCAEKLEVQKKFLLQLAITDLTVSKINIQYIIE